MAHVDYFLVFVFDLGDLAFSQFGRYGVQCLEFKRGLDLVNGIAVRGVADTKAVDCKGTVSVLECYIRVAVLIIVK